MVSVAELALISHRDLDSLAFDSSGLIPAIAQDCDSNEVLMLAWMSSESLAKTIDTGLATYWSRSRSELWTKGATSGNVQRVREIRVDCDSDALLLLVDQSGPACHTGTTTCFEGRVLASQEGAA